MAISKYVRSAVSVFFEYDTPRIVHIRSKKVGIINRTLQLLVIGYIIGYVIVWEKGYQEFENVQSAVTTKVKGIVFTNNSGLERTWDTSDYVIPPQENNAFFVMTNVVVTLNQTQTTCDEDPSVLNINCTSNSDCEKYKGTTLPGSNGPITGNCVNSTFPGHKGKVCEIFGWCPVEKDKAPAKPVLEGSKDFTVFIKNNVEFPRFGVSRRNLPEHENDEFLKICRYDESSARNSTCPIFRLGSIVEEAGFEYNSLAKEGGVMQIVIDWTCNLDDDVEECVPKYKFRRLDRGDFKISRGFNFRFANQYSVEDRIYRNLYKAYGIRFLITVQGKAGKFNIVPLFRNIGSGLALLGIATIISDIVVLYVLKAKNFYREKKYLDVKGQDAFQVLEDSMKEANSETGSISSVTRRLPTNSDAI